MKIKMPKRRTPSSPSRSGQVERKRSQYFVTKTTIEEVIDSDSSEDWEEVETREADPFDLIELEKKQETQGVSHEVTGKRETTRCKEKRSTESNGNEMDEDVLTDSDDLDDALEGYKPSLPQEGIEVELEHPLAKKRKQDRQELIRLSENRLKKQIQENMHKIHFLCLLSRGLLLNRMTRNQMVQALSVSHVTFFSEGMKGMLGSNSRRTRNNRDNSSLGMNPPTTSFLKEFVQRFREYFLLDLDQEIERDLDEEKQLILCLTNKTASTSRQFALLFIAFLRAFRFHFNLNLQVRLVQAMSPVSKTPKDLILSEKQVNRTKSSESKESMRKTNGRKKTKNDVIEISSDDDDDSVTESKGTKRPAYGSGSKSQKNRTLIPCEVWSEVYIEDKWIPVDAVNSIIDEVAKFESMAEGAVTLYRSSPVLYFLSFDDDDYVKECSNRYACKFLTGAFNRPRVEREWIQETLSYYRPKIISEQEIREDKLIEQTLESKPLPKTLNDFKGHPLVVLKKDILTYEAIYPPDSQPIAFFRGEPVYSRKCIEPVRSDLYWKRQARVLKDNVFAYKTVKGRKKWDRLAERYITDLPNELYGFWQTDPYDPPVASDGIVPRNSFGNVELFQPCMLPVGTVHLKIPGLARIATKLNIDCVPAVVGFDNAKHGVIPVIEGYVVCEEFKDVLLDAFKQQRIQEFEKRKEKKLMRVYANWRRLTRALLVREKLNAKYAME